MVARLSPRVIRVLTVPTESFFESKHHGSSWTQDNESPTSQSSLRLRSRAGV